MLTTLEKKEFVLTDRQAEAIDLISSDAMHIMLYGGSRSTKTFTFVRSVVIRAFIASNSRHLIARFRFNHVKASIVYDTFPKVMDLCFPDCSYNLNKSDWFAEFPNGSQIWFTGLDDKDRTEKILGNEYVTIFLNECSQLSYHSRTILLTRLAQKCEYIRDGVIREMRLKFYYDENPPPKGHWTHKLFIEKKEPEERVLLKDPENYSHLLMNPVDNKENLPESYLKNLAGLPKRKRDRFYLGLFADETENALWTTDILNQSRVDCIPEGVRLVRVVVPVDPSGASEDPEENNDDIGIGVIALGSDGIAYILEDLTIHAGPAKWGAIAVSAYQRHDADRIVGEENFGGAMVKFVVDAAATKENMVVSYKSVRASRGKMVRAEPVSALHETGKIKLVGRFDDLEDELLGCTTTGYTGSRSPNRLDWMVWGIYELFPGLTTPDKKEEEPLNIPTLNRLGQKGLRYEGNGRSQGRSVRDFR